jgi:hypothetical protein
MGRVGRFIADEKQRAPGCAWMRAFRSFLSEHPDIRLRIEAVATERVTANTAVRALEEAAEAAESQANPSVASASA